MSENSRIQICLVTLQNSLLYTDARTRVAIGCWGLAPERLEDRRL